MTDKRKSTFPDHVSRSSDDLFIEMLQKPFELIINNTHGIAVRGAGFLNRPRSDIEIPALNWLESPWFSVKKFISMILFIVLLKIKI
jgi:hypothetical protein